MAGEFVVADDQYQLRDVMIGPGSKYRWETTPVLWGGATMRAHDSPFAAAHGVRGGRDLLGSSTKAGRVAILADDATDLRGCLDDLFAAWAPSDDDLAFVGQRLGSKRRRYGRPRRAELVDDATTFEHSALVAVMFEALDPFVYSDTENTAASTVPVLGAGLTPPLTPPLTIGASSGGALTAANAGTVDAPWTGRLDGPLTNPIITHVEQARTLDLDANGGLELGASDFLLIDSRDRSLLLNGSADRRINLDLGSVWFDLDPGTNTILFNADSGTGALTITWRDTWL